MARLKKIVDGSVQLIDLPCGVTRIGRSSFCDLKLQAPIVSKLHALIECGKDSCTLTNESSRGTLLNGQRLSGVSLLHHGDHIQIGLDVLVFLQSTEDVLPVDVHRNSLAELIDDPDESIRHMSAHAGNSVSTAVVEGVFKGYREKICGQILLRDQSIATLASTDSVRKLSQMLRMTELLRTCTKESRLQAIFELLFQFFPQATQFIFAEQEQGLSGKFRVLGMECRGGNASAFVCEEVIDHVARKQECLLLVDQWREAPSEKPRLSTMGRISMMGVPLLGANGGSGVIQALGGIPGAEFQMSDLERLAILAQLLTIVTPLR